MIAFMVPNENAKLKM